MTKPEIILAVIAMLLLFGCQTGEHPQKITISHTGNPDTGLLQIAFEKGYFAEQGLDVKLIQHNSGKASLAAVLNKGADFGVSAETPIVHAAFQQKEFYILAKIFSSDNSEGVIARKDAGITSFSDLKGRKIATVSGTSSEFFLDSILTVNRMKHQDISRVYMNPGELKDAIISGQVDAVSIWQPHIHNIREELGENSLVFYGGSLVYSYEFYIVAEREFIRQNPDAAVRFMRALAKAEEFIKKHTQEAEAIISEKTNKDINFINKVYSPESSLKLSLDQKMVLRLEDQSRWAIGKNLTAGKEVPNYLDYIYVDALEDVKPEAVTIIR